MGFWSSLGKVLSIAGPIAAIPFTGGASGSLLGALGAGHAAAGIGAGLGAAGKLIGGASKPGPNGEPSVAGNVGQIAGNASKALADQQADQDRQRTNRDLIALQSAKFGQDNPLARTKQVAFGDALQNVQDTNIDFQPNSGHLPQFNISGGLRPSLYGPNARKAGGDLSRQALLALMTKSDVPKLSEPQPAGKLQNTLGAIGLGGSFLDAIGPALNRGVAQQSEQGGEFASGTVAGPGLDGLPPLDPEMPTMNPNPDYAALPQMDPSLAGIMSPEEWARLRGQG